MAAGQEWRNSNSTILPLQTSLAFASTDQLPSKVPDIPKNLSLCPWIWGRQVVALKGGGCQQLFQHYLSSGRCLRSCRVCAEKVLNQWKSSTVSVTPKVLIYSLGDGRFPSIFATCEQWQLMNPSLLHLIEGISIWERWDAVRVFVIQLQGQSRECFSLEMIRCVCLSVTAGFYNNVALWLFQIVAHKQHTKRLQGSGNKEASTTACILKQKVNIPAWWHHASGRTTFC